MTTNVSEVFNNVLKGTQNVPITTHVHMTFYRINDYFVLKRKTATARIPERGQYPTQISSKFQHTIFGPIDTACEFLIFGGRSGSENQPVQCKPKQRWPTYNWWTCSTASVYVRSHNFWNTTLITCQWHVNTYAQTHTSSYQSGKTSRLTCGCGSPHLGRFRTRRTGRPIQVLLCYANRL